jgi:hypothetical protein
VKTLLAVTTLALAFAIPATARTTVTPSAAYAKVRGCLLAAGALKVVHDSRQGEPGGGTVFFGRPFTYFGRWASWTFAVTTRGQVLFAVSSSLHLKRGETRTFARCLAPFD